MIDPDVHPPTVPEQLVADLPATDPPLPEPPAAERPLPGLPAPEPPLPGLPAPQPPGPAQLWAASGHLVSTLYDPQLEAVRYARSFVRAQLEAIGLPECADDAGLMVSELAANAVLHARTPFTIHLRPTLEGGARVEVHDRSPFPPVHTAPSASAMSGRGLDLVAAMATRWGSHPLPSDAPGGGLPPGQSGKIVWFEVEASGTPPVVEASVEELLAMWSEEEEPAAPLDPVAGAGGAQAGPLPPPGAPAGARPGPRTASRTAGIITSSLPVVAAACTVVVPDLPAAELLAAKEAMDDLLRELQLLLLATPASGTRLRPVPAAGCADTGPEPPAGGRTSRLNGELVVAARLDAAARAFEGGRRQIREQASRAAARGERVVTVRLQLPASARRAAVRYREAIEATEQLRRSGQLLALPEDVDAHTGIRRHYLDEIIRQLPDDQA